MAAKKTSARKGASKTKTATATARRPFDRKKNPNTAPTKENPHGTYAYARTYTMYEPGGKLVGNFHRRDTANREYEKYARRGVQLEVKETPRAKTGRKFSETSAWGMVRDAYAGGFLKSKKEGGTTMRNKEARTSFLSQASRMWDEATKAARPKKVKRAA